MPPAWAQASPQLHKAQPSALACTHCALHALQTLSVCMSNGLSPACAGTSTDFSNPDLLDTLHWSGMTLLNRTAWHETCNGTDVSRVTDVLGYRALVLATETGSTNTTATLEAANATTTPLVLRSFFVLSLKVCAVCDTRVGCCQGVPFTAHANFA